MGKGPEQTFFQRRLTNGQQVHEEMLNITNHQGNANQNWNEMSSHRCKDGYYQKDKRASLVAQWLRVRLPMQGTRVRPLVRKDPTCHGAAKSVSHNY